MSRRMFVQTAEDRFVIDGNDVLATSRHLPYGTYRASYNGMIGELVFVKQKIVHDKILELPSPESERTLHEIRTFLKPETKRKFKDISVPLVYKHSFLFHGEPGTGKTYLVNKIGELVKDNAIIIKSNEIHVIELATQFLAETQPDDLAVFQLEELDALIAEGGEEDLLAVLDSGTQRDNTIFLATTNNFKDLPKRLIRPGRFASVVEIKAPNIDARRAYIGYRFKGEVDVDSWAKATNGLTIDEIKSVVDQVYFYGSKLEVAVKLVKETRE